MSDPILPLTHLEKIEAGIVAALKAELGAKFLVETYPDKPVDYDFSRADKIALVQYTGSIYRTGGDDAVRRAPEFAVHLNLRAAAQPLRAHVEIDNVWRALDGARIEGATLAVTRDGLVDQDGTDWRYLVTVVCSVPAVRMRRRAPTPIMTDFTKESA